MSIYHGIIGSADHIQNIFPPPSPRKQTHSLSSNNLILPPKNFTTIIVTRPLSQSTSSANSNSNNNNNTTTTTTTTSTTNNLSSPIEMKSELSSSEIDIQLPLSPQNVSFGMIRNFEKITPEEEERRSDELQKILLDTIPVLIKGVETLAVEVEQICNGDSANEKKSNCQVLVDIQKTLREYPRGMGYRCKTVPQNLTGKPKLIAFRSSMDQLIWENISKLSILKDFVEFTLNFQKLCVIGISIRDALNSFVNNKCEYLIKGYEFNTTLSGINIQTRQAASGGSGTSSTTDDQGLDSSITPDESGSTDGNDSDNNNIISINISSVIHNNVKDEINNTSISALKKSQKQQPVVLSRAPKQVMGESTRLLVDTVVNRKCMYREEKASIYREMMNDRLTLLKEDPKKFKQQLLQQRRSKLTNSDQPHETDYNEDTQPPINGARPIGASSNSISPQHSPNAIGSDKEGSSPLFSPAYLSTSPPKSPPKSPEFLGIPMKGKKSHLLGHARSFSADTHNKDGAAMVNGNQLSSVSHRDINTAVLSPPLSPYNEKIIKTYKLLASSPSTSTTSVVVVPHSSTVAASANNNNNATDHQPTNIITTTNDLEWEEPIESELILPCKGYKIDSGNSKCSTICYEEESLQVSYTDDDEYHYQDDFASHEHFNFLGVNKNQPDNPMCISTVIQHETNELLYIIRTGEKDEKYRLPLNGKKDISSKDMIKMIKKSRFNQLANFKLKEVKDNVSFTKQLINFEAKNIHKTFKFGVLYCNDQQGTDENELYSNSSTSDEFQEFLSVLGDRVQLQGWTRYRGGLDVKDNTTGTNSIYKKWRDFEIMYHVAPMIPCRVADEQSVERKRHLGNDIVLIIYKEGNSKLFDPSIIKSNFNHVFAVVQKVSNCNNNNNNNNESNNGNGVVDDVNLENGNSGNINYKISIGCKEEVANFGPAFPKNQIFSNNENFTDFLLTRLINGERATLKSPVFAQKLKRTRKEFLHSFNEFLEM